MSRQRWRVFCRTCGEPTWATDASWISAECRECTEQRQIAADAYDAEEAFWAADDLDTGAAVEDFYAELAP